MRKVIVPLVTFVLGIGAAMLIGRPASGQQPSPANPNPGFAAVTGAIGSQDLTGPYDVVKGWPKDISTLPGNEKWTYGAGESVFAESPDRVFMLFRGELPKMEPPRPTLLPQLCAGSAWRSPSGQKIFNSNRTPARTKSTRRRR